MKVKLNQVLISSPVAPVFDHTDPSHILMTLQSGETDGKRNKHCGVLARPLMTSLSVKVGKVFR